VKKILILEGDEVAGGFEMEPAPHVEKELVERCDVVLGVDAEGDVQFIKHPVQPLKRVMSRTWASYIKALVATEETMEPPERLVLEDSDPMPYGKWQSTPMKEVPASYFRWCWNKFAKDKSPGDDKVADYIRKNLTALQQEDADGIWD